MVLCGSVAWLQAGAVGLGNANGSTGMLRCVQWWVIFDFEACSMCIPPCPRIVSRESARLKSVTASRGDSRRLMNCN